MSNLENVIRIVVLFVGLFYAVRVPYLLIFAQYVTGVEMIHTGWPEKFLIGRGTSTFWSHCLRHMAIAVIIAIICLGGLILTKPIL